MPRIARILPTLAILAAAVLVLAAAPPQEELPRLVFQERGPLTDISVESLGPDGTITRQRLRSTLASPRGGVTGADPAGRSEFVTWMEGGEPWSAFRLEVGGAWSGVRPLNEDLMLLDGATPPSMRMPAVPPEGALPPGARLFVVQFRTVSLPAWRLALREAGAEVLAYFPHNGHIVRMAPATIPQILSMDFVQRIEPYEPWYRLEDPLRDWIQSAGIHAGEPELRVRAMSFEWGPDGKQRIRAAAEALGARVARYWPSGHVLELWVTPDQLLALAGHDEVMWIDRWSPPGYDMNLVRQDAGTDWLETNTGRCGQGVRGEVQDSGIDSNHQDFDGIMLHGAADTTNHGTHTYGIVFGNGDRDGDGAPNATGHLPCAEQGIFADVDSMTDRFAHVQELKSSPYYASFQSNSWGDAFLTTQYNSSSSEMDDIIWRLDIAITQSQSNEGGTLSRAQAWAKNVISVGGIKHFNTPSTADDGWFGSASIGPAADGRVKPDVHYWYDLVYSPKPNNQYANFEGTSATTPEVAGVLGLIAQMWSDNVWNTNPVGGTVFQRLPGFSTLKALLVNNAQQYPFSGTNHDLTRTHQGWGRPSAQIAEERAAKSFIVDQAESLELAEAVLYFVDVAPGETELKVTMVYPDPPGTTSSFVHRINNADLRVTSPSLVTYFGNNGLDVGTESTPGGVPNGIDTVENVFVTNPEPGTWSIEVSAPEVNQDAHLATVEDDLVFSLVVTGAVESSGLSTPGEAGASGGLEVTGYDDATEVLSLTYTTACSADDAVIQYGPLTAADLAAYNWTGQECGLGNTGTHNWDTTGAPASLFFVVVGQTIDVEGSYGRDSGGSERPEATSGACDEPQDLSNSCD